MSKTRSFYPLHNSPLHAITSKRRLAKHLGTDEKSLRRLAKQIKSFSPPYHVFPQKQNGKIRDIENPNLELKIAQRKFKKLLSRIETPKWLMSGKKSVSIFNNADFHKHNKVFLCVDIQSFYKSISKDHVKGCFIRKFEMAEDVAGLLSDIVMFHDKNGVVKNYLPTGAPSSQAIAYWTYHKMFENIHYLAESRGITMSLYVDDLTFSSNRSIPVNFIDLLKEKLSKFNLSLKEKKIKRYGAKAYKSVTGCIITPYNKVKVPNKTRKKILDLTGKDKVEDIEFDRLERLFGSLNSARQIEPDFFPHVYARVKKQYMKLRPLQKKYQKAKSAH